MKMKLIAIALSLTVVSGCASLPAGASVDKMRTAKAAGIGCLAGGVAARLLGNKDDMLKGCAAGAVVGGIASYRKQLTEARELEAAAKAAGLAAEVKTKEVSDGKETVQALDALVITYTASDLQTMDAKTALVFDKLAALSKSAKNELTFTVEGKDKSVCSVPVVELAKRGAIGSHKVVDKCGKGDYRLTITPIPQVQGE